MPTIIDPDALYSDIEAEPILKKKPATQAKNRSLGRGPRFVKDGKAVFYWGRDLIEYLDAHRVTHGADYRARFGRAGEPAA